MTPGDIASLAGVGITIAGGLVAYGVLRQKVDDLRDDHAVLRTDLTKVEAETRGLAGLPDAIRQLGDRFAERLNHLVEITQVKDQHTQSRLDDISTQLKHAANNASMAKDLAQRRAASGRRTDT